MVCWLSAHQDSEDAPFVYKAWLNAGGDTQLVRDPIGSWLAAHKGSEPAGFVYPAWLDAGGDKELVCDAIGSWVAAHKDSVDAPFVYKAWLDAGGDKELVRDAIGSWVAAHKDSEAAGLAEEICTTAEAVLGEVLRCSTDARSAELVDHIVGNLVISPGLREEPYWPRVQAMLHRWIENTSSFRGRSWFYVQQPEFVKAVADLASAAPLSASGQIRFAEWLGGWPAQARAHSRNAIQQLRLNAIGPGAQALLDNILDELPPLADAEAPGVN